jgi:hypothetical protein
VSASLLLHGVIAAVALAPCPSARPAAWQEPVPAVRERATLQEPAPASLPTSTALADGWRAFDCGDLETADECFRAAVRAGEAEGWLGQAEVARRREQRADAIGAFREYLSRVPTDQTRRLDFALLLSWEGLHQEAEYEFLRLERESEDPSLIAAARRGRADALAWSGRHREARALYQQELAAAPDDAELLRALGELESWHGRHGAAAHSFTRSLDAQEHQTTRLLAERARASVRPEAFVQLQAFADDADWRRNKLLIGGSAHLFAARPDARTTVAAEYASFEESSGRDLARRSLVIRQRERPDTFTTLELDAALGDADGDRSWRGGAHAERQLHDRVLAWASIRRDDWIDPIAAHPFDRYNGAFTVDLLRGGILQATTLRGGVLLEREGGAGALLEVHGGPIEDGNRRLESYAQLHWAREHAPGLRTIRRLFHHSVDFADPSASYYSPANLHSWGAGWRWEAQREAWTAFADAALFWQTGAVSDYGVQLGAGVERELESGIRLRLEANFLSTDDRGLSDRYEAYAVLASVIVPF